MKKIIGAGLVAALAVMSVVFFNYQSQERIVIAAILPLSGKGDYLQKTVDTLKYAVSQVNRIKGDKKIELVFADSKTNAAAAKAAFEKLEKKYRPHLYISALGSMGMALAPLAEEYKAPLLSLIASSPEIAKGKKWVYRYYAGAQQEVEPILLMLEYFQVRDLYFLYHDDAYGNAVLREVKKNTVESGIRLTTRSFRNLEETFAQAIEEGKTHEAVYVIGLTPQIKKAVTLLEDYQGLKFASSGVTIPIHRKTIKGPVYVSSPMTYNPSYPFAEKVKQEYEARYGVIFDHHMANMYDAIQIIGGLLKSTESSREAIRKKLDQGFVHSGILGSLVMSPKGHDMEFPLYPAKIEDGKLDFKWQ